MRGLIIGFLHTQWQRSRNPFDKFVRRCRRWSTNVYAAFVCFLDSRRVNHRLWRFLKFALAPYPKPRQSNGHGWIKPQERKFSIREKHMFPGLLFQLPYEEYLKVLLMILSSVPWPHFHIGDQDFECKSDHVYPPTRVDRREATNHKSSRLKNMPKVRSYSNNTQKSPACLPWAQSKG